MSVSCSCLQQANLSLDVQDPMKANKNLLGHTLDLSRNHFSGAAFQIPSLSLGRVVVSASHLPVQVFEVIRSLGGSTRAESLSVREYRAVGFSMRFSVKTYTCLKVPIRQAGFMNPTQQDRHTVSRCAGHIPGWLNWSQVSVELRPNVRLAVRVTEILPPSHTHNMRAALSMSDCQELHGLKFALGG